MTRAAQLALLLAAAFPASALAAACVKDGSTVTLSGKVHHRTTPPDPGDALPGHKYVQLILDQPICMAAGDFDAVAAARTVAIVPEATTRVTAREGSHITLTGKVMHQATASEPPDALQLDVSP